MAALLIGRVLKSTSRTGQLVKIGAASTSRHLSSSAPRTAAGDVGAIRPGGQAHSDAFNRREKAAEDMYIRSREVEILKLLREKVAKQEATLQQDKYLLAELEQNYGGAESEEAWLKQYSRKT